MRNIYLVGMMGAGKSVTGKKLAALLGCGFADLDALLEEKNGATISEIFATKGEAFFREEEAAVLKEASSQSSPCVFATGGGIVLRPENVRYMHSTGVPVYLETSLEVLWERVRGKNNRPLLKVQNPKEALGEILKQRESLYRGACPLCVNTDHQSPEAVARKIMELLEKRS